MQQHLVCAGLPRRGKLALAADGGDDPRTQVSRPLHHEQTCAADRRMDNDGFIRLHGVQSEQQVFGRHGAGQGRGHNIRINTVRNADHLIRADHPPLTVGPGD
jgi:hypothetical protein